MLQKKRKKNFAGSDGQYDVVLSVILVRILPLFFTVQKFSVATGPPTTKLPR